jgi:hypothetical protein
MKFSIQQFIFPAALGLIIAVAPSMNALAATETGSKAKLTLSTGVDYSSGDYGQTIDTQITYAPVTAKIKMDRWTGKLTIPYISITGPGVVIGGSEGSTAGAAGVKSTESGLGDVTSSLAYTAPLGSEDTKATFTGKIKFPTADEDRNLGTGQFDYTLQAGLTHNIGDFYLSGSVARKFNGSSARFQLDDVWKYSAGAGYSFTPETTLGVSYDYRQASTATGDAASEASTFISHKLNEDWSLQVYAYTGFTDSSPDLGGGLQVSYQFDPFDISDE